MKKIISAVMAAVMLLSVVFALSSCTTESKKVKVIDIPLTDEVYAFAVNKADTELLSQVNSFLAEIKENGTFQSIVDKFFAGKGTPTGYTAGTEDASKDQLIVATNAFFAPFEYMEGDKFYGIDMEIMAALAEKLGKELVIKDMDFDATVTNVNAGYSDIVAAGLSYREDRAELVNFTDTYYNASQMIVVKADDTTFDNCRTAADVEAVLKELTSADKAGAQNGTTGYFYLVGDEENYEGYACTTTGYDNAAMAVEDMLNGNISFVVADEGPAKLIAKNING